MPEPASLLLTVVTPLSLHLDAVPVLAVRAEDESGWLGILPRHADLITVLKVSVLVYRDCDGREHFVGVRGGVLQVSGRRHVQVMAREAIFGDDLQALQAAVRKQQAELVAAEATVHDRLARLSSGVLHRMADYVRTIRPTLATRLPRE